MNKRHQTDEQMMAHKCYSKEIMNKAELFARFNRATLPHMSMGVCLCLICKHLCTYCTLCSIQCVCLYMSFTLFMIYYINQPLACVHVENTAKHRHTYTYMHMYYTMRKCSKNTITAITSARIVSRHNLLLFRELSLMKY